MALKIYHNPRCSKSRQALELLRQNGIEPEIVEYLKNPPGLQEISELLGKLDAEPREIMRSNESEYKDNRLDRPELSREDLILALQQNPKLLQRPIVADADRAVIGRPPERVLELLPQ